MKHILARFIMIAVLFLARAEAQVPSLLNYQGRVTVGGTNFNGTGQFKFALVDISGATNFWSNDGTANGQPASGVPLSVVNGLYAVPLGDTTVSNMLVPVSAPVLASSNLWLRVWFNDGATGFQQLAPDQRITAVAFALVAASVDPSSDVRALRLNIGAGNYLSGTGAAIAGGAANSAGTNYAFIGGGQTNVVSGFGAVVVGGGLNLASGALAFLGGGYSNAASGYASAVGGGVLNAASGTNAFVGGGYGNLATNTEASIVGGEYNGAYGVVSAVGGGYANLASGYAATVPGGYGNLASGAYSFAGGAGAGATNYSSFVWADAATNNVFYSTANNSFSVRASGGVRFFANAAGTVGVQLAPGGNTFSAASDRNLKENFQPVDVRAVLDRLVATPVTEWNLISQDPAIRHIGPMAQDFKASFGVGEDERHISTTDADGVAFAAIQGLNQVVQEKDARITALENRLNEMEQRLQWLEQKVNPSP